MHLIKSSINYDRYFIKKTSVFEKIYYEFQNFIDMLDISNDLYHFLNNHLLNSKKKWLFLYIIYHFDNFSSTIIKFIQRTNCKKKKGITYRYMNLWNIKKKLVKINVITAIPLLNIIEDYILKLVKKNNKNRKFFLEKKVNNSIIGGLIIRIEDKEWDNSLEENFRKLLKHLKNHI